MASNTRSMINAQNLSFDNNQVVNIVARDQIINNFNSSYEDERCNIALWLSPLNFKASQSQFLQIHEDGTGNWLLESPTFLNWRDGTSQTLWCPGNPGAGKTILASVVVDHLQTFFQDEDVGIACIYCNYKEQTTQTATNLIASLLKQFVQDRSLISDTIKSFHDLHKNQSTSPTLDEFIKALEIEIKTYTKVFIVVDALDECSENNGCRTNFLKALRSLSRSINLIVTSRDLPSIEQYFRDARRIYVRATDGDITKFVQNHLADLLDLVDLQDVATKRIVDSARGMFLLARLHINALLNQDNEEAVLYALDNLPDEIDQIYDEAMERIGQQTNTKNLAIRVLSWIVYATRPLSVEELRHALAVSPNMTKMNDRALVFRTKLTSVCAGLVVVDEQENTVRLAHYTTQQYFENQRESRFPNAEVEIAATCLTYLSFDVFARGYSNNDAEFESLLKDNPFLDYAARNWGFHARRHQKSILNLAMGFLGDGPKVACASQVLLVEFQILSQYFPREFSSIHMAAYWGLDEVVRGEVDNEGEADGVDSNGRAPLSYAAARGHGAVVKLLLARDDVQADSMDEDGRTPLSYAAENGHSAIVKLLLAWDDVQTDLKDSHGQTPLSYAAQNGQDAIVKLLLARDDVQSDSKDWYCRTPLLYAARRGYHSTMKLLLADDDVEADSKDLYGQTPLSYAAENGQDAIVKLLLARDDVQPDREDLGGRTPLSYAAESGYDGIINLILTRDDVQADFKDRHNQTPLLFAARSGHDAAVNLLLARDDVQSDSKDWSRRTPLSYAAENGHDAIVKLFLAQDDVQADSKDSYNRTPLSYAAQNGHDAIVRLLLARGDVQPDRKDLGGRTPLSYATRSGHDAIVNLLLARDDVQADRKDSDGRTPLAYAAKNGHSAIVKLLLARDDVQTNSKDSYNHTPLFYAARRGYDAVVELLFSRNDVQADSKDLDGRTPLSYAAGNCYGAIVTLLLARDDVRADSKDSYNQTPLLYAACNGHDAIVKLLLARDDVQADSKDTDGRTPLSYAAESGYGDVVKLLLARDDVQAASKDVYNQTPLSYAVQRGHTAIVKLLLARDDVQADSEDSHGRTPLFYAACNGYDTIIKLLLDRDDV